MNSGSSGMGFCESKCQYNKLQARFEINTIGLPRRENLPNVGTMGIEKLLSNLLSDLLLGLYLSKEV